MAEEKGASLIYLPGAEPARDGDVVPAKLDVITEIPDQIDFRCPEQRLSRDEFGNAIVVPCAAPCQAFPKTRAVRHAKPACEAWEKGHRNRAWVSAFLVKADVAVRFAPADENYHGKPR